jgi:hypothetical protein
MIDVVVKKSEGFIPKTVTMDQAKDTGMAMTLIALLTGYFGHKPYGIAAAIVLLLAAMTWPALYRPVARLWFGLSQVLGTVMSKILLSILFFVLVTPIGYARKLSGADSLQLRKWKKDRSSVFKVRNHTFTSGDIQHPY